MTREEFAEWRHNSVTEEVFQTLRAAKGAYIDMLASGATLGSEHETAKAVGTIQAFDYLLNLEFEEESA